MAVKFKFTMRSGPATGAVYPLEKESLSIGRDSANGIQINDPEMSRRHAQLQLQGGKYVLEDLGSTNGTLVNGQKLAAPHVLKNGDLVSFGEQIVLVFEATDPDPGSTLAVSRKDAPRPIAAVEPATPPTAKPYVNQIPASPTVTPPALLTPAAPKRNPVIVFAAIGAVICLCACAAFFWFIDANLLWCDIFPFLASWGFQC